MKGVKLASLGGYTIVEVMIVLAVSGLILISALTAINGKVNKAQFSSGLNTFASQIESSIEQVSDGEYQDIPIHCTKASSGPSTQVNFAPVAQAQGTNADCTFVGNLLQFIPTSSTLSPNFSNTSYRVFTLAADRYCNNTTDTPITSGCPSSTQPYAYTGLAPVNGQSGYNLTSNQTMPDSLMVSAMCVITSATTCSASQKLLSIPPQASDPNYLIGFVEGLGSLDSDSNINGAQSSPNIIYMLNTNSISLDTANSNLVNGSSVQVATGACIGVTDGNQYAELDIGQGSGASSGAFQVNIKHDSNQGSQCNGS